MFILTTLTGLLKFVFYALKKIKQQGGVKYKVLDTVFTVFSYMETLLALFLTNHYIK